MNKQIWIKIILLSLLYALVAYLVFAFLYSLFNKETAFAQVLVSPMAVCFAVIVFITNIISNKKRYGGKDK